jgi:hypothetical protein
MADVMKEAEEVLPLGDGFSHHKKAWIGTETILKTSVSKWESQLSLAQSEMICLENEPQAGLPLVKITRKRTTNLSATSTLKKPALTRPRKDLTQAMSMSF